MGDAAGKGGQKQRVKVASSPTRCPYCHESVEVAGEEQRVCRECLSRHHAACWGELERCGSCACTEALEEAPPLEQTGGEQTCHACGLLGLRTRYNCPQCRGCTCATCYRPRFRRCVDCAVELIQAEKRLEQVRAGYENQQGVVALTIFALLGAVAGIIVAIANSAELLGVMSILGFIVSLALTLLAWRSNARLRDEVHSLELELAPYPEPSLGSKLKEGAKRLLGGLGMDG